MSHARQQIRDRIITTLTGLTTTGSKVYNTRLYSLVPNANLPCLLVYTNDEACEREYGSPSTYKRMCVVSIEGIAEGNTSIENTLDTISGEVEDALGADPNLNGKAIEISLTSTEVEITAESEKPIGLIRLNYDVLYYTRATNSQTPKI